MIKILISLNLALRIHNMEIRVPLSRPDIIEADIQSVVEVLRSPFLSLGPKLREFEEAFERYVGRRYAVAVNSGTSGLFLCLKAIGLKPKDEVITTPFTFIATVTSIMMTGAVPVFADIDPVTLNLDLREVEKKITRKTKAILAVDIFGNPAGMDEVRKLADAYGLDMIEDSCEALGSELKGRKAGTFGRAGVFGFYPNKQMTTGEGGMIVTDDEELAQICISLRNQGRGRGNGWLAHERLGYNYRLSDINCALGLSQLKRIEEFVRKRNAVAQMYLERLADEKRIVLPSVPKEARMSWFVFVVRLADRFLPAQRNEVLNRLTERGIQVSNYFPPVYLQPFIAKALKHKEGDFPVTDRVSSRTVALPFHNNLTEQEVDLVCQELRDVLDAVC
jgi:perosamine synthetase